jgi:hypothetical protein
LKNAVRTMTESRRGIKEQNIIEITAENRSTKVCAIAEPRVAAVRGGD